MSDTRDSRERPLAVGEDHHQGPVFGPIPREFSEEVRKRSRYRAKNALRRIRRAFSLRDFSDDGSGGVFDEEEAVERKQVSDRPTRTSDSERLVPFVPQEYVLITPDGDPDSFPVPVSDVEKLGEKLPEGFEPMDVLESTSVYTELVGYGWWQHHPYCLVGEGSLVRYGWFRRFGVWVCEQGSSLITAWQDAMMKHDLSSLKNYLDRVSVE